MLVFFRAANFLLENGYWEDWNPTLCSVNGIGQSGMGTGHNLHILYFIVVIKLVCICIIILDVLLDVLLGFHPLSHSDAISASAPACALEPSEVSAVVMPTYSNPLSRQPASVHSTKGTTCTVLGLEMGMCVVGGASECCLWIIAASSKGKTVKIFVGDVLYLSLSLELNKPSLSAPLPPNA